MGDASLSEDLNQKSFQVLFLLLVIFSAILISYTMASNSLHGVDEARYGIISKDMLASGDWITPRMGTEPYFRKPPLRFWLQAPLFYFFGYSEWVIRFWSAAAAVGSILMTVQMGRMLFGSRAGLWAGFAFSTCIQFLYVHGATTGEMDTLLLFFTTSSLYFFLKSEEEPSYLLVSAILMGLASLTKNLAGLIPLGMAILYLIITGKWRIYRTYRIGLSLIVFFVLSFSWILAMLVIHQGDFLKNFFVRQVYQRAVSNEFDSGVDQARSWHHGLLFCCENYVLRILPVDASTDSRSRSGVLTLARMAQEPTDSPTFMVRDFSNGVGSLQKQISLVHHPALSTNVHSHRLLLAFVTKRKCSYPEIIPAGGDFDFRSFVFHSKY